MSVDRVRGRLKQKINAAVFRTTLAAMHRDSGVSVSRFAHLMNVPPKTLQQYLAGARGTPGLAIPAARWALLQLGHSVTLSAGDSRR